MEARVRTLFQNTVLRYLFAVALVAITFALRLWLTPLTGTGAPFVLFFAAVMATSLFAGVGPGMCAVLLSMPFAAYTFVMGAGYSIGQASFQSLLFAVDGIVVVYLTFLVKKGRQAAQDASLEAGAANRQLRVANEQITRSMTRAREVIELSPDAFFQADLDARFTDVNQAACRLLGYDREELRDKTIFDIVQAEDRPRLKAVKAELFVPGYVHRAEWTLKRKDGIFVHVEVSANSLSEGRWQAFARNISERKRAEEALRRSEAQYRGLIEHMPDGVFAYQGGRIVYANDAFVRLLGHDDRAALVGRSALELLHPDDHAAVTDRIRALQQTGLSAPPRESRMIARDGSWKSVESVGVLAEFEGQSSIVVIVRDLTVRKQAEDKLKAANAFLDAIIENIPLTLFIKESQSLRFVRFNRAGEDLVGWPRETVIGKTDYDLWPRAQAEFFIEKDRETLKGGEVVDIAEEPVETRHQGVRFLHTRKVPIHDSEGRAVYLLGISDDITERRRTEQERQFLAEANVALSSSLDYEHTLGTVAQLVVRDFADWCIVDIMEEHENLRRLKMAGADPANAALCARFEQVRLDRNRPYLVRPVIEERQPLLIEHVSSEFLESVAQSPEHLQALRAISPTSIIAVPLLMRGQLLGAIALISSTPSRIYRAGDLRLAEALADRAAMAIENARLYRDSVQATQLRDHVLAIVAHDLRNPLSAILMQLWALRPHGRESERRSRKPAEVIERAARRMNRLIQDLLDVSRMEAGQLSIEPARLSARELIVGAVDMQRPLASSSSLELRVDVAPDAPDVWGDRDRLLQVFENLIGNAIKFTRAGGCITVGAASRDHEVIFRVADTGSGIAPENLPRVFDRFWQATNADRQGAGLGLPITKGIVEAHGGRVWVESTPNRGTTFFFTIPQPTPEHGRPSGPSGSSLLDGYRAA